MSVFNDFENIIRCKRVFFVHESNLNTFTDNSFQVCTTIAICFIHEIIQINFTEVLITPFSYVNFEDFFAFIFFGQVNIKSFVETSLA